MYMFQQQKNKPKEPEISAIAFTEIEKLYRRAMKLQGIKIVFTLERTSYKTHHLPCSSSLYIFFIYLSSLLIQSLLKET